MKVKSYRDLLVWQKAMDLVIEVYNITKLMPKEEMYALSNQMRRAVVSIPSNIAEGHARKSSKEFVNFLSIAQGSNAELQTQILLCTRLQYIDLNQSEKMLAICEEIGKMINSIMAKLIPNP